LLLVAFLLVNAPYCHLSFVLASVVQGDAANCNTITKSKTYRKANQKKKKTENDTKIETKDDCQLLQSIIIFWTTKEMKMKCTVLEG